MIFEGIPSGDLECFCLLVTKETFIELTGKKPGKYDIGRFAVKGSPHRYMVYPSDMLGIDAHDKSLHVISVEAVKKEKVK
jgi:hypothetical protein